MFLKETHTDQYLHLSSNHPLEHKRGTKVVKTLLQQAETVVSDMDERQQERDHIRNALGVNGYPDWMLAEKKEGGVDKETQEDTEEAKPVKNNKRKKFPVILPYIRGFSEELRRVFSGFGNLLTSSPLKTVTSVIKR